MQYNEKTPTLTAGSNAIPAKRLVKISSGPVVDLCASTDVYFDGYTEAEGGAAAGLVTVNANRCGAPILTAEGQITAGTEVIFGDNGKVKAATVGSKGIVGKALTAAGADGDDIQVLLGCGQRLTAAQ